MNVIPGTGEVEEAYVVGVLKGEVEAVGLVVALRLTLPKVGRGGGVDEDTLEQEYEYYVWKQIILFNYSQIFLFGSLTIQVSL